MVDFHTASKLYVEFYIEIRETKGNEIERERDDKYERKNEKKKKKDKRRERIKFNL